jgi:hypothetical protein
VRRRLRLSLWICVDLSISACDDWISVFYNTVLYDLTNDEGREPKMSKKAAQQLKLKRLEENAFRVGINKSFL